MLLFLRLRLLRHIERIPLLNPSERGIVAAAYRTSVGVQRRVPLVRGKEAKAVVVC